LPDEISDNLSCSLVLLLKEKMRSIKHYNSRLWFDALNFFETRGADQTVLRCLDIQDRYGNFSQFCTSIA